MVYSKKICSGKMGHFGPEKAHPHNSGLALKIFKVFQSERG